MRKLLVLIIAIMFFFAPLVNAETDFGPMGPAPSSGDGVSDGSGFDVPGGAILEDLMF